MTQFTNQIRACHALNQCAETFGRYPHHLFRTALDAFENGATDSDVKSILWHCMKSEKVTSS